MVAGRTLAGPVSARALGLASRSKVAILLLLVICAAGARLRLTLGTSPADESPSAEQKDRPPPAQKKPALDRAGDPLPPRALARAGTVRLRHGEALAFFPDGKTLVAGGRDGAVRLWDVATGRERLALAGHKGGVWSVAVSRDGKTVVSGGVDGTVRIWDAPTGKQRLAITGLTEDVWSVDISRDGKTVAAGDRSGKVRLWDATTGKLRRELGGFNGSSSSVVFSPDGNTVAAQGSSDHQVAVWDLATGRELYRISLKEHVFGVQFSPDGKTLATHGDAVHLYDPFSGTERRRLALRNGSVAALAFSPDNKTIVASGFVGNPEVLFWDVRTGKELPAALRQLEGGAPALVFSPNGKILASRSTEWVIRLTDVETGRDRLTFQAHTGSVQAVAFTPDGRSLLTGGDRTVRFWDPATGHPQRLLEHTSTPLSFAFSPDGKTLAAGGGNPTNAVPDKVVRLWDLDTGGHLRDLRGTTGMQNIRSVVISPDGRTLAAAGYWDATVRLWDLASGDVLRTLPRRHGAYAVAFSPDGALLVTASSASGVRFWAPDGSAERPGLPAPRVVDLVFAPDGQTLVTAGDKELQLWDVASRKQILRLAGHEDRVTCVAISPDGRLLASGSDDRTVRLWSVATGKELLKLTGHRGFVSSVAFAPDGRALASGSWDATALVWDIADIAARPDVALHLTFKEQELLWQALAGGDPAAAHRAVWSLVRAGRQGVVVVRERLRATDLPSAEQMEKWLADLDSDRFAVRQKATRELEKLGRMAEPPLRRLLAGRPPLEVRRRAQELLSRLEREEISPELLRVRRAVRVLGSVDTPEGRRMLEELSRKGVSEATAALRRLPVRSP